MSLWDELLNPALPENVLHTWEGDRFAATSWGELTSEGLRKAAGLRELGVAEGSNVACVLTNSRDVCSSILGVWAAGGTVLSVPTPARGMAIDDYQAQVGRICAQADAELLLTEERFGSALNIPDGPRSAFYERLDGEPGPASPQADDAPALVQYSSGTTGEPHGCVLTAAAIASHLERLREKLGIDPARDRIVSWLPLSHDMGLIGTLMVCWGIGTDLVVGTPERFLASPRTWVQDCVDFEATITVGPSFAVKVAARAAATSPPSGDLALRIWIVGSDHVGWEALEAINEELGPAGLRRSMMTPAYGLAEATLAVTMTALELEPESMVVDSQALLGGSLREVSPDHEHAGRIVGSGTPLRGTEVRIDPEGAAELGDFGPDHEVGEICVRSPSLATGYYGSPERSGSRFRDGELRTGDIGFLDGEQLYVLGRSDDMFVVAGRNIHAGELEALMMREPGVRPGGCALIDLHGQSDRVLCLVETESDFSARDQLARSISGIALSHAGIRVRECVFVARGALPKTPSGKVQRYRCRELAVAEDDRVLGRVRT
jgi:fatty-acyl-CoA synthase